MNPLLKTTIFVLTAIVLTVATGFLFASPAKASQSAVALPGENLTAPVQDNPLSTNNGEGHDLDDIQELREHWSKPDYSNDERRQMAGILVICGSVAGYGAINRRRSSAH